LLRGTYPTVDGSVEPRPGRSCGDRTCAASGPPAAQL